MGVFARNLQDDVIKKLKGEKLFADKLMPDIHKGAVFPAIRNNYIDFYYKGRRLFHYDKNGFKTHYKYLILNEVDQPYVLESGIEPGKYLVKDFHSGYDSIKRSCTTYFQAETNMVSQFYKQSLFCEKRMEDPGNNLFLLDIECALESINDPEEEPGRKTIDKIDLVFLNKDTEELFFCEVKRYSDSRIRSQNNPISSQLEAIRQIKKYDEQIKDKKGIIESAYANYITCMNSVMGTTIIAEKLTVLQSMALLVTGFDSSQKKEGLNAIYGYLEQIKDRVVYVGSPRGSSLKKIYDAARHSGTNA